MFWSPREALISILPSTRQLGISEESEGLWVASWTPVFTLNSRDRRVWCRRAKVSGQGLLFQSLRFVCRIPEAGQDGGLFTVPSL